MSKKKVSGSRKKVKKIVTKKKVVKKKVVKKPLKKTSGPAIHPDDDASATGPVTLHDNMPIKPSPLKYNAVETKPDYKKMLLAAETKDIRNIVDRMTINGVEMEHIADKVKDKALYNKVAMALTGMNAEEVDNSVDEIPTVELHEDDFEDEDDDGIY